MQKLHSTGKVRNIGVSNFGITHLDWLLSSPTCKVSNASRASYGSYSSALTDCAQVVPAVNQIELLPKNPSPKLVAYNTSKGIHNTGYSCLGSAGSPLYRNKTLIDLAESKGKTVQQVVIMWGVQKGWSVIPKSVNPERISANFAIDGWELTPDEVAIVDAIPERFKVCDGSFLPPEMHGKVFLGDDE